VTAASHTAFPHHWDGNKQPTELQRKTKDSQQVVLACFKTVMYGSAISFFLMWSLQHKHVFLLSLTISARKTHWLEKHKF
jgi:hypothetical protein